MKGRVGRHHVEVDQSIKIEQTQDDTVIAFSDGIQRAILIPATVKRACQQKLQGRGVKPGMIALRMFVAGLLLLLEEQIENIAGVKVDKEYTGREGEIKGLLLRVILKWSPTFSARAITFQSIGRKSPAHQLAWHTHKGKRKPERRVTLQELLRYC